LLVDFAMPEMNGATVARLTRQRRPDLPILLISGKADHAALRASAAEMPVLHKPFKQAELTTRIAGLLKSA
jgi:CheY-like chemotaxis protein